MNRVCSGWRQWDTIRMKASGHIPHFDRMFIAAAVAAFALLLFVTTAPAQAPNNLDRAAVLNHLNAVISWYRNASSADQVPGLPSDVVYQDTAQNLSVQALRLAFDSARAEAEIIGTGPANPTGPANGQPPAGGQPQSYAQMQSRVAATVADLQSQLDAANKQIEEANTANRQNLIAQRDALQGQLDLEKSMQDAIQKMVGFVETSEASNQGLAGTINTLARSVPEALGNGNSKTPAAVKSAASTTRNASTSGLISQALALFGDFGAMRRIDALEKETLRVRDRADTVRKPLRDNLVATIRRGNELTNQGAAGSSNPAPKPADVQKEYQTLTADFKQYSNAIVPLTQEIVVLDQSRANLVEWRQSISRESRNALLSLLIHVSGIAIALGIVLLLGEVWRRLTVRYVHDIRRRRQILILRRFVIGFLLGIVVILGFVSEFSSLATFAGFVTAGIAVGLQTVLLSVAAYFFVIGRYGIRVGDRISISGVTGDVIDIGLVRLYLMELGGPAVDLYPTGRIVVFSNSVLFQPTTPLFKQLPGTEYSWHEVVLVLSAGGNHKAVQEKVTAAVNSVYSQYRADIERQTGYVAGHAEFHLKSPGPDSKLQFGDAGLELTVRYPVELRKAAEIDDQMTQKLVDLIDADPELKSAVAGSPKIQAIVKG